MKFTKVLEDRRSIRAYLDKPVEMEDLKKLIKAAILAPSWKNSQTARYFVVTSDKMLDQMKENVLYEGNAKKVQNAPALIVTAYEPGQSGYHEDKPVDAKAANEAWGMFDLGLAVENLVLQAEALELGSLIMGIYNETVCRKILNIPEKLVLGPIVAIGYTHQKPDRPKRKKVKEIAEFF